MSIRSFARMALLSSVVLSGVTFAADLEVLNPAVRAMPPGAPASGAYVTLINHTGTDRFIVDAESEAADTVEIHLSEMKGDTMVMARVEQIPLPAHDKAVLKPGGYHIMLIGLRSPLKAGDEVEFNLVMKNGERLPMVAPVLSPEDMVAYMPADMPKHNMKHMMSHGDMAHGDMKHH